MINVTGCTCNVVGPLLSCRFKHPPPLFTSHRAAYARIATHQPTLMCPRINSRARLVAVAELHSLAWISLVERAVSGAISASCAVWLDLSATLSLSDGSEPLSLASHVTL